MASLMKASQMYIANLHLISQNYTLGPKKWRPEINFLRPSPSQKILFSSHKPPLDLLFISLSSDENKK